MSYESLIPSMDHLRLARELWSLEGEIEFHRHVENFVYFARKNGARAVLRLTEPEHRSFEEVEAELHWLDHLSSSGLRVGRPIRSESSRFLERIESAGRVLFATLFSFAPGKMIRDSDEYTPELLYAQGEFLARMHTATATYHPISERVRRPEWDHDIGYCIACKGLDPEDSYPYREFQELSQLLRGLDRSPETYGLIHADLHFGNFFVDDGRITAFDFDDSCYHWHLYDIASPLFIFNRMDQKGSRASRRNYLDPYLKGYQSVRAIPSGGMPLLEEFYRFRVASVYHWAKARVKEGSFDQTAIEWTRRILPWCIEELKNPALDR